MTIKRVTFLQELLAFMGLEGRLHLEWISSAEAQKFVQVVTDFTEKIKTMGPSPLSMFNKRIEPLSFSPTSGYAEENTTERPIIQIDKKREAKSA